VLSPVEPLYLHISFCFAVISIRKRLKDNIKVDVMEINCEDENCIELAQVSDSGISSVVSQFI
jgi:hypothetical protein